MLHLNYSFVAFLITSLKIKLFVVQYIRNYGEDMKKEIIINSDNLMQELGEKIGRLCFPNTLITMEGDLGAGKTTMTKGIGKGLDIKRVINSPTFTIMKIYEGRLTLYHMDVYRIDENSGDDYLEEYFQNGGVCVIEWAGNIEGMIKDNHMKINILINKDNSRKVIIEGNNEYERIIDKL